MILNPEKLNNTEEERKALLEIIRLYFGLSRSECKTVINDKNRSTETNRATVLF